MDFENQETVKKEKPKVFFKNITFNDGTVLNLNRNSIVVFTGSNNCGKSQVLKDGEKHIIKSSRHSTVVIRDAEYDFEGEIDEPIFLKDHFNLSEDGFYSVIGSNSGQDKSSLLNSWNEHRFYGNLDKAFIKRLGTELRLKVSNSLKRNDNPENHPIYKLNKSDRLMQTISDYFHQAFGVDLVLNRYEIQTIPIHVGDAPDKNAYTMANEDEYYAQVTNMPILQNQGDGMRSFASILFDTFTSEYSITLIDEPEAFLHPPQARVLGKMLAKNNPNDRQLFVSTHSEDFLQGLLDADNENVTVIRINREGKINKMSTLQNNDIKSLWSNPILRYSNILSGLFHEKVVVCESDYDCLFYQAMINAMYEQKGEIAPDILFTHCGGKARAKDVVAALKAIDVPVVAICDFDLLNQSLYFRPLVTSFGMDWNDIFLSGMKTIYDSMNAKKSTGFDAWDHIKEIGKAGFSGDEPSAYETVEKKCKASGLFVVPVGEMECFDKTINKKKKEWVYTVLENYDLATEPNLENARKFIQEVVDYKLSKSD